MSEGTNQPVGPSDVLSIREKKSGAGGAINRAPTDELHLIEKLRSGNEGAFVSLIDHYHTAMLRLAMAYVPVQSVAEEVVQEAWLGVLKGLQRFEGRSSLKTWIFRILTNCAKTRAVREGRSVPFSSLPDFDTDVAEPAVDPDRFLPADHPKAPGQWASFPSNWDDIPENRLVSQETFMRIEAAIQALPAHQRTVITLRDIDGWTAEETCNFLDISEANQRVLLHRARSKVRRALEQYFEEE
jgi:RNA polymerase sigma-70 factor, ECF subfamily